MKSPLVVVMWILAAVILALVIKIALSPEPAGEHVSGEAIAEEEAEDGDGIPLVLWDDEYLSHKDDGTYEAEVYNWYGLVSLTLDELTGKIQTISACCETETVELGAAENLKVIWDTWDEVRLRKKLMELEARILELEHR